MTEAPVPDSMLENNDCEQNYSFYAYVYVRDDTSGNTKHKITIHVKARSKPEIPGDIVGGRDYITGVSMKKPIGRKIWTISEGKEKVEYKLKGEV